MPQFDWTIDWGTVLAVLTMLVGLWRFSITQDRRDRKIDLVLFGNAEQGVNGIVTDVKNLKREMYDPQHGAVPMLRHHITSIRIALARKDISTPDPN